MVTVVSQCLRSRLVSAACLVVVVLSFLLPPVKAFGVPMCQFKELTHYPCLGCGLTRSFVDMAHLHFARAGFYHPLGWVLFPLTLAVAALLPAPQALRERLVAWTDAHGLLVNGLGIGLAVVFVGYGIVRIAWLAVTHRPSPW